MDCQKSLISLVFDPHLYDERNQASTYHTTNISRFSTWPKKCSIQNQLAPTSTITHVVNK